MTHINCVIGHSGQLYISKEQTIKVFGKTYLQRSNIMIPAYAVSEFADKKPKGKRAKIKMAFMLLGKYQTAITKHSTKALIEHTTGTKVSDSLISEVAKTHGLNKYRQGGNVFYFPSEAIL